MAGKNFDIIVKEQFKFLETEYSFRLSKYHKESWGHQSIYLNETKGIKIIYEYREAYIFIILYQLKDGKLVENPQSIEDSTILYSYGLDDLIGLRNFQALIRPAFQYGEKSEYYDKENGLSLYMSKFAENLKLYAKDILFGDFTVFSELDKVVKSRIKKYKQK